MEKNLMKCPIDNKNLMEDAFEDGVFCNGFMAASDHRNMGKRHLIGIVKVYDKEIPSCENYEAFVDVSWHYAGNSVAIKVIAVDFAEDFETVRNEVFEHYKDLFNGWENEDGLTVRFNSDGDTLYVHFYWDLDKC